MTTPTDDMRAPRDRDRRDMGADADLSELPCIFCRAPVSPPWRDEHIIPESLGCPFALVLRNGEVYGNCNNRLSKADTKLLEVLGAFRPFGRFKTKKGKWPRVDLKNATFSRNDSGLELRFREEGLVNEEGAVVCVQPNAAGVRLTLSVQQRFDGRLSRGVHKIAFEYFALLRGREAALDSQFDALRNYVLGATGGFRHVLLLPSFLGEPTHIVNGVELMFDGEDGAPVVTIQLCGIRLMASLSSDPTSILRMGRIANSVMHATEIAVGTRLMTFDQQGRFQLP